MSQSDNIERSLSSSSENEFATPSFEEWLVLVEAQLGAGSYTKTLCHETAEGLRLSPIYRQEDVAHLQAPNTSPAHPPDIRSTRTNIDKPQNWQITQSITPQAPATLNEELQSNSSSDLESISLKLDQATRCRLDAGTEPAHSSLQQAKGTVLGNLSEYSAAFDGLDLASTVIHFDTGATPTAALGLLTALYESRNISFQNLQGSLLSDPHAEFCTQHNIACRWQDLNREICACIEWTREHAPHFRCLGIDARPYLDASGNAVQQIAYAGAALIDQLRSLTNQGLSIEKALRSVHIHFGIGSQLFVEVAKFRAFRCIWSQLLAAFNAHELAGELQVFAHCSEWNKTRFDPHTNMLRTTTEALSAVLGGAYCIDTLPFDYSLGAPDDFSRRIARNVQLILREESHLDRVLDPAGGSYYVEHLSDEFASSAWTIIQGIEQNGGMQAAIRQGSVQNTLADTKQAFEKNFFRRKSALVGTTMFVNPDEQSPSPTTAPKPTLANIEKLYRSHLDSRSITKTQQALEQIKSSQSIVDSSRKAALAGATSYEICNELAEPLTNDNPIQNIQISRPSQRYEALRDKAAAIKRLCGRWPTALILGFGPLSSYNARLEFTQGYLEPGGFRIHKNIGIDSKEKAVELAAAAKAEITVICAADEAYPQLVPGLARELKQTCPNTILLLAGCLEESAREFEISGVDAFIQLGSDHLGFLEDLHMHLEGSK